jgi:hypothetical protein
MLHTLFFSFLFCRPFAVERERVLCFVSCDLSERARVYWEGVLPALNIEWKPFVCLFLFDLLLLFFGFMIIHDVIYVKTEPPPTLAGHTSN